MKKNILTAMFIFLAALCLTAPVQAGDWITIAKKTVNYKADSDTVMLRGKERNITHIKLKCTQGSVKLHKVTINMTDGDSKVVDNLGVLTKGISSRSISLPKGEGKPKSIDLEYDSVGSQALRLAGVSKKAKIEVLGKKQNK